MTKWKLGAVVLLFISCLGSIGLYLLARDSSGEREIQRLIEAAAYSQRPGAGRLSGQPYLAPGFRVAPSDRLASAQILLLREPDSQFRRELQGRIYLAAGEWQNFVDLIQSTDPTHRDAETLNDLGATYLALSENDPILLLDALHAFQRALMSNAEKPEPLFNLSVVYKKLRLSSMVGQSFKRYSVLDSVSSWHTELANSPQTDEASVVAELEHAVEMHDLIRAEELFRHNPELCRRLAMQYALSEHQAPPAALQFIATQVEHQYGDKTVSAMLQPLSSGRQRQETLAVRRLVNQGAQLYVDGNFSASLNAYEEASESAGKALSIFDRIWVDLNMVDTEIRLGQFEKARQRLRRIVQTADDNDLLWIKAKALSIYGATLKLTSSYVQMLDLLSQADYELSRLDASHDRIRLLYYLAAYRYFAGDQEEALRLALDCLQLVDDSDSVRISTLDWLIGSILYRRGMPEDALMFAKESVEQSGKGPYANGIEFLSSSTLAGLYESLSHPGLAGEYLSIAEDAFAKIPEGFDRVRYELQLGIVKSRLKIDAHAYAEAERLLENNLNLYSQQPFSATPLLSQSLMQLAQVYAETGRVQKAGRKFGEAIDVVEKDDEYLQSEMLRVKFDDERRNLYDAAIEFEFKNGSMEAAWAYLQRYRAKLFLEFLAPFNPDLAPARATLKPEEMQRRVPKDAQVLEYVLLKDRLLIWVVTDKIFTVRSVPVVRQDLESQVQAVLEKLRKAEDADPLLTRLEGLLIEPVSDLLDGNRTLIVIPDRALHGLPFGALKIPGSGEHLIQKFPIAVSPSLNYLLANDGVQPTRGAIVGFGSQNGGAAELKELAAVSGMYSKARTLAGVQVDKAAFLGELKRAAVFHYAGHSVTDAADPLRSAILLDGNRSGPNSVTAVDISQQRLSPNAVVILSSCDSSVGNGRDGIGMRGLTSAFLIAGAGSVVGSLWPVESSAAADLMIGFHQAFERERKPVAVAMRDAQLAFLKQFPQLANPYYWSGFEVTGSLSVVR